MSKGTVVKYISGFQEFVFFLLSKDFLCVCVYCTYADTHRSLKREPESLELELQVAVDQVARRGCWEANSASLGEQVLFIPEPPLQSRETFQNCGFLCANIP